MLIGMQIELKRTNGLMFQLVVKLGVRVEIVLRRWHVFFENGTLGEGYFTMVRVVRANDLDVVEAKIGSGG